MKKLSVFIFVILMVFGMGYIASATPITHSYTGNITSIDSALLGGGAPFVIGQDFTISYTFESTTSDSNASPGGASYLNAITSYTVQVGSYTASASTGSIFIFDDTAIDSYEAATASLTGDSVNGLSVQSGFVILRDPGGPGPISNTDLPITPYDPADFGSITFMSLYFDDDTNVIAEDIRLNPIPEPTSLLLLGTGLGVLGLAAYRRRRK